MMSNTTPPIGWKAKDFRLQGVDGKTYSLAEVRGPTGTLVVFICNHCPYVNSVRAAILWAAGRLFSPIWARPNQSE